MTYATQCEQVSKEAGLSLNLAALGEQVRTMSQTVACSAYQALLSRIVASVMLPAISQKYDIRRRSILGQRAGIVLLRCDVSVRRWRWKLLVLPVR